MNNWLKRRIELSKQYQEAAFSKINELVFTQRKNKVITSNDGRQFIEFVSCSYLGLDLDPRVLVASGKNLSLSGFTFP